MRILIERSGGFTGIKRRYEREIDDTQLDALKSLVADNADDANYPDAFHYRVTIGSGEESCTFEVSEEALVKVLGEFS
jgi:hypothetical protein